MVFFTITAIIITIVKMIVESFITGNPHWVSNVALIAKGLGGSIVFFTFWDTVEYLVQQHKAKH